MNATETRTEYPNLRWNIEFTMGRTYGARCASVTKQGAADFLATFGTVAHNWAGGQQFDVSHGSPSRSYQTEAGARRAVARYLGGSL